MPPDSAEALARARRAYLIAAAGCGKTEAVAVAAGMWGDGAQLVLTHTHAGVKALKDRLARIGAPRGRVHVDTIAGFALRYAASFPRRARIPTTEPSGDEEWAAVYAGARRVFDGQVGRRVLLESFAGLYVDEYQDCTKDQHDLVLAMADSLACRVVLDPLQAVFGFAGPLVSETGDLAPTFERLPDLTTPWRWRVHNEALGEWLIDVRSHLESGLPVDLVGAPVERGYANRPAQLATCHRLASRDGSVAAIGQWPADCQSIGRGLRGRFTCMESVECPDLLAWARRMEAATGAARAAVTIDFASSCMTQVRTVLKAAKASFDAGTLPSPKGSSQVRAAVSALIEAASEEDVGAISIALTAIEKIPGRVLFRRELWREMERTLRGWSPDRHPTLERAAWHIRDDGRHMGRRVERRTVSRTVLIKGLEFDHAVVLDADRYDAVNLYVALTRPSTTLTVLAAGSRVTPKAPVSRAAGTGVSK